MDKQARAEEMAATVANYVQAVPGHVGCFTVAKSVTTLTAMLRDAILDGVVPHNTTLQMFQQQLRAADCVYTVDIGGGSCTCSDHTLHHTVCKHILAILHTQATVSFTSLPTSLTEQPHLVVDSQYTSTVPLQAGAEPPLGTADTEANELHELSSGTDDLGARVPCETDFGFWRLAKPAKPWRLGFA